MEYFAPTLLTLQRFAETFLLHVPHIALAIIFIFVTYFCALLVFHTINLSLTRAKIRKNLIQVFSKLSSTLVWILGILIIASIIFPSVTFAHILTTLGLSLVAIGFAFKDIFENFLAGIMILLREPFHLGDYIETLDEEGEVEKVSIRNTHIRRSDGVRIVIPNAILFKNPIRVLTDLQLRRVCETFSINYADNINGIRQLIQQAVEKCETVSKQQYVQIYVRSLANNIEFEIYWWTQSRPGDIRYSRNEVLTSVKVALETANIDVPSSYVLAFQHPLTIEEVNKNPK